MQEETTMASDEDDYLYANDELKVSRALRTTTLDQLLADDKAETERAEELLRWYHGKISREAAESLLKEGIAFFLQHLNVRNGNSNWKTTQK